MKITNYYLLPNTLFISLLTVLICSALSCKKTTVVENRFTNITTLDCRNLVIKNIILKDSIVEITLANTCKNCEDDWAYLGMVMIDRQHYDTLAQTRCLTCSVCPKNGETKTYELITKLQTLPNLQTLKFNFGYLCNDLSYLP